jgi:hypothetical protein
VLPALPPLPLLPAAALPPAPAPPPVPVVPAPADPELPEPPPALAPPPPLGGSALVGAQPTNATNSEQTRTADGRSFPTVMADSLRAIATLGIVARVECALSTAGQRTRSSFSALRFHASLSRRFREPVWHPLLRVRLPATGSPPFHDFHVTRA